MQRQNSDVKYQTKRMQFVEETWQTPDGIITRPCIHHPGAVLLVPERDAESVVLLRQFRYAVAEWIWELPAGTCEPNEDPLATAKRELVEETGYTASHVSKLSQFWPAPGLTDEVMTVFRCRGLQPAHAERDQGEMIEVHMCSRADVANLVASGTLRDAKSLLGLQLAGWLQLGAAPC